MNKARDPVWQFVSVLFSFLAIFVSLVFANLLLASVFFVVALILLLVLYLNLSSGNLVFFRVMSDTVVLSIVVSEGIKEDVSVLYKGQKIDEDIHLIKLIIWNGSSDSILHEKFKNPIKMNFGKDAKVLSVQAKSSKPSTIKEEIENKQLLKVNAGHLELQPIWLEKENFIVLEIMITSYQGEITLDETRIIVGGEVLDWSKTKYNRFYKHLNKFVEIYSLPLPVVVFFAFGFIVNKYIVPLFSVNPGDTSTFITGYLLYLIAILTPAFLCWRLIKPYCQFWITKISRLIE